MEDYSKFYVHANLILKYLRGELSQKEEIELEKWLKGDSRHQEIFDRLTNEDQITSEIATFIVTEKAAARQKLLATVTHPKKIHLWPRLLAAAAVVVLAALIFFYKAPNENGRSIKDSQTTLVDISPGQNRATLTLSNGKTIALNGLKSSVVIDTKSINYADGTPVTAELGEAPADAQTIVETPRGGTYQVVLPDGSKVWLNASSSLKFPVSFANKQQRVVYLEGEGYFEVAKISTQPFVVHSARQVVKVLGTHFNLNSYEDEPYTKTTLLEGSVSVSPESASTADNRAVILKPGQQGRLSAGTLKVVQADIERAVAWKNGLFIFKNQTLPEIMKEAARWYDIEIKYEGYKASNLTYSGVLPRNTNLSAIFKMLNATGNIKFVVEGKVVTIMN